jgi:hypothetical protein
VYGNVDFEILLAEGVPDVRPLAVIIKGNPIYITNPTIQPMAERFYAEIQQLLERRGFRVKLDSGEPFTSPDKHAVLWVGHSRGIDRLRFAPREVQTIALRTGDLGDGAYPSKSIQAADPRHYQLSKEDKQLLSAG